ncbi:LLM class F420-dependent oxidoreductase [Cellulomonas marina]|uniref:Probable F420-dependent oxidoreductase, Rv1855c family n=1 Tax=Cellulomonas marina TaxID=988821 RepID=A0A1I0XQW1_9CELL|nr:LLM class F420-dependent oxidoreductase [Cellulomonas marina]GIG30042.1 LLM class F420-dependent oxidoreductase [Cellulomonas marina]SFB03057.1 probable F420-dependent oxidoreductase, Rv1855c family [Cellulomonas marina]
MRFGLFIPQGWRQDLTGIETAQHWPVMRDLALHADEGDVWESVWVYDHFHAVPEPNGEAVHEAWSLINAFAAVTRRVRLGQMCTCMAYRNPAYLAKVAATADVVSGGRVEMGIGAGWYEHEWRAYGYGFPRAGERLAMLDEGVQIFEQLWRDGVATLDGKHYQVDGAQLAPLPLQAGGPPLWIAGGGEKKTLRIAAEHAAYTNFDGSPEGFVHKSEILRGHCEDLGRDFDSIVRSANYNVVIGATDAEVDDRIAWVEEHMSRTVPDKAPGIAEDFRNGPLVGTPEKIVETLRQLEGLGMTYAITYFAEAAYDRSGIELFEREVVPALRG